MKMEIKGKKKLVCGVILFILLILLPLMYVGVDDFFLGNKISLDLWMQKKTMKEKEFIKFHLARLVQGEDRRKLDDTGFACHRSYQSNHCVSTKPVRIDTRNMTVYVPSDDLRHNETTVWPYPWNGYYVGGVSTVRIVQYTSTTPPPPCNFHHHVPVVVFSSGHIGNTYHEMSEIIIPLFLTVRQFQSRVMFVVEDYIPSFISKYNTILTHLSAHEPMNPATVPAIHCFPASIVGLKYHGILALNSSNIPGGYGMPEFRHFIFDTFGLKTTKVSEITRPRLLLLSRKFTRRILNEDETIAMIKDVGFQVIVVNRFDNHDLKKLSHVINTCNVLLGVHGAGLTYDMFLPAGAVVVQVEPLDLEHYAKVIFADNARSMGMEYLHYKIEEEESSLVKVFGRNSSVITDTASVSKHNGIMNSRNVFYEQQNVKLNLVRFRETIVKAFSIVTVPRL
ncbi:alpha-1,3-arabinosyltransferase XAT2-like isoform X1 [Salvia divinorum]|uniref:Alpha-1,3-arabinosyltransferase XAT2-like isoform X1 n=1 Tax=Salvia divinorum TaxID=28513 RepID=A0ABD1GUD7_SALDI